MIKIGYYVKDEKFIQKIWELTFYHYEILVYELTSDHIEEIKDLKIDLLIFDFYPNQIDSLIHFEKIKEELNIKGICVLDEYSDDLVNEVLNHHIQYICDKDICAKGLYVMILRMIQNSKRLQTSIYERIEQVCSTKGISSHLKGYAYLKSAIIYAFENNQKEYRMKDVYDTIAKKYHTTSSRVEKNLRLAIHMSGSILSNSKFINMCYKEIFNE